MTHSYDFWKVKFVMIMCVYVCGGGCACVEAGVTGDGGGFTVGSVGDS